MDRSLEWIETLAELRAAKTPCAMVVVTEVKGSAPREPGARMLVADGELAWGTIGGGNLEHLALEHARELLSRAHPTSDSVVYPLAEKAGQCCGGQVTLFFETYRWTRRTVAIFGAGHVGQRLGALAPWLGADLVLVDGRREEELRPRPPAERPYRLLCIDEPEAEIDALPRDALVLVMTHSHPLDLALFERALRRGTFPFVGLIGSARKWRRFEKRLRARGLSEAEIARVRCPIGVSQTSKDPAAIALSTAAQLVEAMEMLAASERAARSAAAAD
jgi:xanthine dehydrogenase accessory factor